MPSKVVSFEARIGIQCSLKFIDMEGLSDGKSVKTILQHVNPKKLVRKLMIVLYNL